MSPSDMALLWENYKTTGAEDLRNQIILNYMVLVTYVAEDAAKILPNDIERTDLISYGTFGLIDAIEKFEPERGWKFETYAKPRIKGAIFDELRAIDWVPRRVRDKDRTIEHGKPSTRQLLISLDEINPDDTATTRTDDPTAQYDIDETSRTLTNEINRLADRDRTILDLYYNKEQTLKQIGTTLDVTESCISQAHTKLIHRLRTRLTKI